MRDPGRRSVEAAIDHARCTLGLLMRLGAFRKRRSDPEELLRFEARIHLTLLPENVLPEHLRELTCRVLDQPQPVGRLTNADRNAVIARAVEGIAKRGFDRTRNEATRDWESACSIVAKALAQLELDLSERTVEDISTESRRSENSTR